MTLQKVGAGAALLVSLVLGGCNYQIVGPMSQAVEVPDGPQAERTVTVADDLLRCYAGEPWARFAATEYVDGQKQVVYQMVMKDGKPEPRLNKQGKPIPEIFIHRVGGARVGNVTGKAIYGDVGTGSMLPVEFNSTLIQALGMAMNPAMKVVDRGETSALAYEVTYGIRSRAMMAKVKPMTSYVVGDASGLDALSSAAAQIALNGWGGGPRQERINVEINLRLMEAGDGPDAFTLIHSVTVRKQYVQSEIAAFVGTALNINGGKKLLTADVEAISRTVLQGMVRPMINAATAELVGHLKGAPSICRRQAEQYLSKMREPEPGTGQVIAAKG